MIYQVLLFEDDPVDKEIIIKAFLDYASRSEHRMQLRVVWFRHPMQRPAEGRASGGYPIELRSSEFAPEIITLDGPEIVTEERGKLSWWQGEFHGAVMDIFSQASRPSGEAYASWLQSSHFGGPVILTSQRSIPALCFPWIPNLFRVPKTAGDPWAKHVIEILVQGLTFLDERLPTVGPQGRPAETALAQFYEHSRTDFRRNVKRWKSLWIGDESRMCEQMHKFFELDRLSERDWGRRILRDPVKSHWQRVLQEVDSSPLQDVPHVVWFDCGETIRTQSLEAINQSLERLKALTPLVLVLGNRLEGVPQTLEGQLLKNCCCFMPRSALEESPANWAVSSVDHLSRVYQQWRWVKAALRKKGEGSIGEYPLMGLSRLVEAYLRVYLMARGMYRIGGDNAPNIVSWFSTVPLASELINKNFRKEFLAALGDLESQKGEMPKIRHIISNGPERRQG